MERRSRRTSRTAPTPQSHQPTTSSMDSYVPPRRLSPAQTRNSLGVASPTGWVTYVAHLAPHSSASQPYVFQPSQLHAHDPVHSD